MSTSDSNEGIPLGETDKSGWGDEKIQQNFRVGSTMYNLLTSVQDMVGEKSETGAATKMIEDFLPEVHKIVAPLQLAGTIMSNYKEWVNSEASKLDYTGGDIMFDNDTERQLAPRLWSNHVSAAADISNMSKMSKSAVYRMCIVCGIAEKSEFADMDIPEYMGGINQNLSPAMQRRVDNKWEAISAEISQQYAEFEKFLKIYFIDNREFTLAKFNDYPGLARDFMEEYVYQRDLHYKYSDRLKERRDGIKKGLEALEETIQESGIEFEGEL